MKRAALICEAALGSSANRNFISNAVFVVTPAGVLVIDALETAQARLEQSRVDLAPWIDAQARLVPADEWLDGPRDLVVGGVRLHE